MVALCGTVWFDGGLDAAGLLLLGATALLAVPVAVSEAARFVLWPRLLLAAWGLGILLSLSFAVHRADMTEAVLTYALPPFAFLTAARLYRRPWGPAVLVGILSASAAAYWGNAFLSWLGPPLAGFRSNWLAVLWHNPSGALMGSFAVLALAFAVRGRGARAAPAILVVGLTLAGVWLTGSRGALIATGFGLVVTAWASRAVGWRRLAAGAGASFLVAAVSVAVLLEVGGTRTNGLDPSDRVPASAAEEPDLVRIESAAAGTLRARFAHMDAAVALFSDHPVTGAGPGSYGELGNRRARPGANLTRSAHNEYLEVLAEGGLLFGVPFLLVGVAVGVLAIRGVWSAGTTQGWVRASLTAGAAGTAVLLLVHTGADIDWRYPVIPAVLAVAAAALYGTRRRDRWRQRDGVAAVPVVVALVLGVAAAGVETATRTERASDDRELPLPAAPWDVYRRAEAARVLGGDGDVVAARQALAPAARWNPGSPSIEQMRRVLAYRSGAVAADQLRNILEGTRSGASPYVWVAEALLDDGRLDAAAAVVREGLALTAEHPGMPYAAAELWELEVEVTAATDGCRAARRVVTEAAADEATQRFVRDLDDRVRSVLEERCDA